MAEAKNTEPRRNSKEFHAPPLDEITFEVRNKQGKIKKVPALHIGFSEKRLFIPYNPPPLWNSLDSKQQGEKGPPGAGIDFADASIEEWLQLTSYLIEDLHWLLKLPHHRFWSQVAYDDNIHCCIHSYLLNAPRYYDLNNFLLNKDIPPNWKPVYATWQEVHRNIFMIFLRMSTYKESKKSHISPPNFGELIYNQYIFDIPTLMNLTVVYGKQNRALLTKMINNIFMVQPSYYDDLSVVIDGLILVLDQIEEKLVLKNKLKMENLFELHSPVMREEKHAMPSNLDFKDVQALVSHVADTLITISAFIDIFPDGCNTFHLHNFELRIALFYESVFRIFFDYLKEMEEKDPKLSKMSKKLLYLVDQAKAATLKMFRDIIFGACLQPILETNSKADEYIESFLQIMSTCLNGKSFICDYENNFPFEEDLDMISQTQTELDETRTSFILNSIYSIMGKSVTKEPQLYFAAKKNSETKHMDKLFQESCAEGATANNVEQIELESLIFSVLDVFPDLGQGFIQACLEYYNFEYEKVISALLEDTLPSSLSSLDRNEYTYKPSVRPKDNSSYAKNKPSFSGLLAERKNIFDGDEFDVFSRNEIDRSKIHKGKKTAYRDGASLLDDKEDVQAVKETYKKYEVTVSERVVTGNDEAVLLYDYDDEYDDTYDDVSRSAWADAPHPGDDIDLGRKFTIPRVLRTKDFVEEGEEELEEDDEIPANPNHINISQQNGSKSTQSSSTGFEQGASSKYDQRSSSKYDQRSSSRHDQVNGSGYGRGASSKASSSRFNQVDGSEYGRAAISQASSSKYEQRGGGSGGSRTYSSKYDRPSSKYEQGSASRTENGHSFDRASNDETSGAHYNPNTTEFRPKKEWNNVKGKAKGQGQDDKTLHARKSKEQHKGAYGNHNRKAQSDRKRNRGMIPT